MFVRSLFAAITFCALMPLVGHAQSTPTPAGIGAPKRVENTTGIAEIEKVSLGGVDQTISIRGDNLANPILLLLHGGPGFSELLFFRSYNSDLEKSFVVVNWDQRGAGLSYSPTIAPESMNIAQFVSDAHTLVGMLKNRFGKKKIFLLGHSWGSILGVTLAHDYPEDFYAYVGVGQFTNLMDNERVSFRYTLDKALADKNQPAVDALRRIEHGYPSRDRDAIKSLVMQRRWLAHYGGVFYGDMNYQKLFAGIRAEEKSQYNSEQSSEGEEFSMNSLWPQLFDVNLNVNDTDFKIPVYILAGKADYNTPFELAKNYFGKIHAPQKEFIWFEKSGHFIPFEEPEKFNALMRDRILKENFIVGDGKAQAPVIRK
jgi:pimeloyl-ACP methyl ester carboxylesterase